MIVSVDFDGVCTVRDAWPEIGEIDGAMLRALRRAQGAGHRLILNTARTGQYLAQALQACELQRVLFDGVNENLRERIERFGGDCRKVSADLYLEDRAVGWDRLRALDALIAMAKGGRE